MPPSDKQLADFAEQLRDGDEVVRYEAAKALAEQSAPEALTLLADALGDSSYRVRARAVDGLCRFPVDRVFELVLPALRDLARASRRSGALEILARFGARATPLVAGLLHEELHDVRIFATAILAEIHDPGSLEALVEALSDPDENVRHGACEALGRIGDARAVPHLVERLRQDVFWVKFAAASALGDIGDPSGTPALLEQLEDEMLGQVAVQALARIGDPAAVPALVELVSSQDATLRREAVAALVRVQTNLKKSGLEDESFLTAIRDALSATSVVDELLVSLDSPDKETRRTAVLGLGLLREERAAIRLVALLDDYDLVEAVVAALRELGASALPALRQALADPDPKTKVSVLRCIAWLDVPNAAEACLACLEDEDGEVRYQAVVAMVHVAAQPQIERALIERLGDEREEVRNLAVETLSRSQSSTLTDQLAEALQRGDAPFRCATIRLLGRLRATDKAASIQALVKDEHATVRAAACEALGALGLAAQALTLLAGAAVDAAPLVRKAAAKALASVRAPEAEKALLGLTEDDDPEVCLVALESVGETQSAAALPRLIEAYQRGDERTQLVVVRSVGKQRAPAAMQFLGSLVTDANPDIQSLALESLGAAGDPAAIPAVSMGLLDDDWVVRTQAIRSLAQLAGRRAIPQLLERLGDSEDVVKREAISALGGLGDASVVPALLPLLHDDSLMLEVLATLRKVGIPDVAALFDFFGTCNTRVRCLLLDLLGGLRERRATDALIELLSDELFVVRQHAARALGLIRDPRAGPALSRASRDDPSSEVREEAARALRELDPKA